MISLTFAIRPRIWLFPKIRYNILWDVICYICWLFCVLISWNVSENRYLYPNRMVVGRVTNLSFPSYESCPQADAADSTLIYYAHWSFRQMARLSMAQFKAHRWSWLNQAMRTSTGCTVYPYICTALHTIIQIVSKVFVPYRCVRTPWDVLKARWMPQLKSDMHSRRPHIVREINIALTGGEDITYWPSVTLVHVFSKLRSRARDRDSLLTLIASVFPMDMFNVSSPSAISAEVLFHYCKEQLDTSDKDQR